MKKLKDILYKVPIEAVYGSTNMNISQVIFDSRKVGKDDLFVAQKGVTLDGHQFISKAIQQGASGIICEDLPVEKVEGITFVQVRDSNQALAIVASNFYDNPSKLKLIGITGTNGKTTIASLSHQLFLQSRLQNRAAIYSKDFDPPKRVHHHTYNSRCSNYQQIFVRNGRVWGNVLFYGSEFTWNSSKKN